jgi:hypothetical protein
MPITLTQTQLTWLDKLYEANCNNRAASAIPAATFKTLHLHGYVEGAAEAAHISPHGIGAVIQMRIAAEQEKKSQKKGKKPCSTNSSKNTNPETFSSPKFAW